MSETLGPLRGGGDTLYGEGLARSFLSTRNAPYAEAWRQAALDCWFFHEALYGELAFKRVDVAECPDVLRRERNNRYVYGVLPTKDHPLTCCITAGASCVG